MKRLAAFLILLLIGTCAYTQRTIKGKISSRHGNPIPGSSVFLSNTSIGTVSDSEGNFQLTNLPAGRYDLVVSSVGYKTYSTTITTDQLPMELNVTMDQLIRILDEVTVTKYEVGSWNKWGQLFTETFLGRTPNAKRCKIINAKAITFRYYKSDKRLIAFCDEPLIIENKGLGYKLTYKLEDFEVNLGQGNSYYAGFPFFEELDKKTGNRSKVARDKAFYGSVMHFMRSVYADSMLENGFEVHRMERVPNLEKQRIRKIFDPRNPQGLQQDTFLYYQQIMRQRDYTDVHYKEVLTADSIIAKVEGEYKQLYFTDYLNVIYRREMEDKEYVNYLQGEVIFSDQRRKPGYQQSYLLLVNDHPVVIDALGNFYPANELYTISYWAWSDKVGDMLPLDYKPADSK
jgi:hypothetical protein